MVCKYNEHKQNNVITVTNNNVKYYENLANQHSKEAASFVVKSAGYAKDAEECLEACQSLKNNLKEDVFEVVKLHSEDYENPHGVTSEQVGAYSKTEINALLTEKLAQKNPNLVAGTNISILDNGDGTQTITSENTIISDYSVFENKPSVNNIVLVGNKSSRDLGLASVSDLPVNVSELQNDSGYLTEHQDISGKQDVLSEGDGILIKNNIVSTINRLDCNLSNLSSAGKKVLDGQWIAIENILSTAKTAGTYTLDLSGHLPNDNYSYEVLLNSDYETVSTGHKTVSIYTDVIAEMQIADMTSNSTTSSNTFIVPLISKSVTLKISGSLSSGQLTLFGYRRIGTNS